MTKRLAVFVFVLLSIPLSGSAADWTPEFRKAVEKGDAAVRNVLDKNPKLVNSINESEETALHVAADKGHAALAKLLITRGANVNARAMNYDTPLLYAVRKARNIEIAKMLLTARAWVNVRNFEDYTPLWYAVEAGSLDMAKLLINYGAKMDVDICDGMAVLHLATLKGNLKMCRLLVEKGAKVDGAKWQTPLCYAAQAGRLDVARYLIEKGANVNVKFGSETPLTNAVSNKHYAVARLLISKSADVTVRSEHGSTLLHTAVTEGDTRLVELLISHGADVNARLPDIPIPHGSLHQFVQKGETPLGLALRCKKDDIAGDLRKYGAVE